MLTTSGDFWILAFKSLKTEFECTWLECTWYKIGTSSHGSKCYIFLLEPYGSRRKKKLLHQDHSEKNFYTKCRIASGYTFKIFTSLKVIHILSMIIIHILSMIISKRNVEENYVILKNAMFQQKVINRFLKKTLYFN